MSQDIIELSSDEEAAQPARKMRQIVKDPAVKDLHDVSPDTACWSDF